MEKAIALTVRARIAIALDIPGKETATALAVRARVAAALFPEG